MSDTKLGKLIEGAANRDAIHIAIAPMIANHDLNPGEHVGIMADGTAGVEIGKPAIGIVDPFLTNRVMKGERFFLCLYQQTVTGMRHHWSHPSFADEPIQETSESKIEAEKILREFCKEYCPYVGKEYCPYRTVDDAFNALVAAWKYGEDIFVCQGTDTPEDVITDPIKVALAAYTGRLRPDFYFSCTC